MGPLSSCDRASVLAIAVIGRFSIHAGAHGPEPSRETLARDRTQVSYTFAEHPATAVLSEVADVSGRRLSRRSASNEGEWEPIRIYLHTEELRKDIPDEEVFEHVHENVLQAATRWLSQALRVRRVRGRLQLKQHCSMTNLVSGSCLQVADNYRACGDATIPAEHFRTQRYCADNLDVFCEVSPGGKGIPAADFALYVTARRTATCLSGNTAAYAGVCQQDQHDRPVAGFLNFCQLPNSAEWQSGMALTLHEIFHALGFSSAIFAYFRNDNGQPRTRRTAQGLPYYDGFAYQAGPTTIERTTTPGGTQRHYVVLPRVLHAARVHYNCMSLRRVALEEGGGDGTSFSHWEDRSMQSEVMSPDANHYPRVSTMTLALLEDSGWYKPDYTLAGAFTYGRGKGCGFLEQSCVQNGTTPFPDYFCTAPGESCKTWSRIRGCSHDRLAKAVCGNCIHDEPLPAEYQHFRNPRMGGRQQYMGYCPYWEPYSFCREGPASGPNYYGETWGAQSRCLMSDAIEDKWVAMDETMGSCRIIRCREKELQIRVGTTWVTCGNGEAGLKKQVGSGWNGGVICPSHAEVCGEDYTGTAHDDALCLFPGVLRNGRCVCGPGALGEDCSIEDLESKRQAHPFGLQYAQQEVALTVGVPLAMSRGLKIWPFRPKIISGPGILAFSVSPPLPAGVNLSADGGILSGTPALAVARGPYTIRANGGHSASTTTLFISVACPAERPDCSSTSPLWPSAFPDEAQGAGTPSHNFTTIADKTTPTVRVVLTVAFEDLQAGPGLANFMEESEIAMSAAAQAQLAVAHVIARASGGTRIDLYLREDDVEEVRNTTAPQSVFDAAVRRLVAKLQSEESALRESTFGRTYLQNVVVFGQTHEEGLMQLYPQFEDYDKRFWQRLWDEYWPFVLIVIALVWCCCCWSCCSKTKSTPEEEPLQVRLPVHSQSLRESAGTGAGELSPVPPDMSLVPPDIVQAVIIGVPAASATVAGEREKGEAVSRMLDMGFEFEAAVQALRASGWDVNRAVTQLSAGSAGPV